MCLNAPRQQQFILYVACGNFVKHGISIVQRTGDQPITTVFATRTKQILIPQVCDGLLTGIKEGIQLTPKCRFYSAGATTWQNKGGGKTIVISSLY